MTQPNPIGVHFIPTHTGRQHYDFIRDMVPGIVKIVGSGQVGTPDVQVMADAYSAAPEAVHLYRNQPMSEEHDFLWRDPIAAAKAHVATMNSELALRVQQAKERKLLLPEREQWRITGICEPIIELFPRKEDMSNYDEWLAMMNTRTPKLDDYMSTFMDESDKVSLQSGIGNFSGGQPANLKPDEYATYDWFPKTRKVIEAANGRHFLSVDEYWDIQGPEEKVDWWTCRWKHCNWDCRIGVVEAGIDRQIRTDQYEGNRGWIGHMEAQAYVDQHERYVRMCLQDPRFLWETPYTLDGDKIWWSFFIEGCTKQMIALSAKLRGEPDTAPTTPPITIHLPEIHGPAPTGPTATPWTSAGSRIRSGPGKTYPVIANMATGVPMAITGRNADSTWWQVAHPLFGTGWVSETVVSLAEADGVPVVEVDAQPEQPQPTPSQPTLAPIEPRVAQAILAVESGGNAFGPGGRPLIRFEAHIFKQQFQNDERFDQFFRFNPDKPWTEQERRITINHPWKPIHTGNQQDENDAFAEAQMMDVEAAHNSISMGAGQIMGFNHARIGYPTAQAMYQAFKSAPLQTIGFINFVLADPDLAAAMRNKDWRTVAAKYNGTGNVDQYSKLLQQAYANLGAA